MTTVSHLPKYAVTRPAQCLHPDQLAATASHLMVRAGKHLRLDELREAGVADGMAAGQQTPVALALQAHLRTTSTACHSAAGKAAGGLLKCSALVDAPCQGTSRQCAALK